MAPDVPLLIEPPHRTRLTAAGLDSLESCLAFAGGDEVKALVPGRDVRRVSAAGTTYYVKRVRGGGWRDVIQECRVLHRLERAGLPVPQPVAIGAVEGRAVLVTVGLPATSTLERLLLAGGHAPERIERFAIRVATLLRSLHDCGVNHRDFYAGHVLVDPNDRLFVVDFGRAELRRRVPRRRIVKDLAAFHFSLPLRAFDDGARLLLLRTYLGARSSDRGLRRWQAAIERKRRRIERHVEHMLERGERNVHVNR